MKFSETLKNIFYQFTDKGLIDNVRRKSFDTFTNEPAVFNAPMYGLTPPDIFLGSNDYRGTLGSAIYGPNNSSNFLELFECVPEIFAPIHAIASRIANADFQLRKYRNDQVVYDNEYWNKLYNTPNPLQHFRELMYEAIVYELVTGNEYMYFNTPSTLNKDFKNVMAIWNLPADQITPITDKEIKLFTATTLDDIIKRYKLDKNTSFEPKDILHIRAINLKWCDRKVKGSSPLHSASKAVANLIAVYEARNVIYTKRGALGAIVSRKTDDSGMIPLAKGEKARLREDINNDFGLTGGRATYAVTDQPVDFIKFGMSISELEPFEETYLDAKMIYSVLGVPEDLMPNQKGATFENQIQAERRLYNGVIIPKANMYMQSLTNQLGLPEAKLYLHASFETVDALQENKKEKSIVDKTNGDTYLQRFMTGVCTLNEWVVSTGSDKVNNPLYETRLFDMDEAQLTKVREIISLKAPGIQSNTQDNGNQATQAN